MLTTSFKTLHLIENDIVSLRDHEVCQSSVFEKIKRFVSSSYDKSQIQALADHILSKFTDTHEFDSHLALAQAFVARYENTNNGKKISQILDRSLNELHPHLQFMHHKNKSNFEKWKTYGQDPSIYPRHSDFCTFAETSGLLSQIKVTRDAFREIEGEAAVKLNGEWIKWTEFKDQFKAIYSEKYNETFIVNKDNQVFTYLDNGKGLQIHHPFLSENTATSVLNNDDYLKVLAKARTFVREGEETFTAEELEIRNQKRTFILQVVSSSVNGLNTRFNKLITNPKHPYIRLIMGDDISASPFKMGEVYEVGYIPKKNITLPLFATQGSFRSPDRFGYAKCDEKVVTNIAITPQEAQAFFNYVSDYQRNEVNIGNPIGFHILKQNCSSFTRAAIEETVGIKIHNEISIGMLIPKISPVWISKIGALFKKIKSNTMSLAKYCIQILPGWLKQPINNTAKKIKDTFKRVMDVLTAVVFIPVKIAFGDAFGSGGRAFVHFGDAPKFIKPRLQKLTQWFAFSSYKVNLPGIVQDWQRKQASTVIYNHPIKLCIVP